MGVETKRHQIFICYDILKRLIDEEEDLIFEIEPEWCTLKFFDELNYEFEGENNGKRKNWGAFLGSQYFGGRKVC